MVETLEELSEEDQIVVNLLVACGKAVKLGHMKPFLLKHKDLSEARARLKYDRNLRGSEESFKEFRSEMELVQLF